MKEISIAHKLATWFDDSAVEFAQLLTTLLMTVCGVLISDEVCNIISNHWQYFKDNKSVIQGTTLFLFVAAAVLQVILYRAQGKKRQKMASLQDRIEELESDNASWAVDLKTLATGYLYTYSISSLGFGSRAENTERITLYVHDSSGSFVPVARYSSNANYRSIARHKYPDDQGCIGDAWKNGRVFRNRYPNAETQLDSYLDACEAEGISREVASGLRMKSRLLFGHRVDDVGGEKPLAVIIVESTDRGRYTEAQLSEHFDIIGDKYIRRLAERLSPRLPTLSDASKVGL